MALDQRSLHSFDGTRIVYQVGGRGERWLVVANGYGGSFWAWRDVFALLEDRYRILIWDYRGFYSSAVPADGANLRIEDNCRDLDALMEAEGIERAVLVGWSVGVQVALEQYRRRPETVEALALVAGSHGRVLHRSGDGRITAMVMPRVVGPWSRLAAALGPAPLRPLQLVARSRLPIRFFHLLGLVDGAPESLHEALRSVLTLDWSVYLRMGQLADEHDTEDLLPEVRVPTLVVAGERDIVTLPRVMRHIASRIPGAIYFEIPGATHYAVMEHPRLVANRIESFVRGHP